eukprot:400206-Pleurochrysis_carterae.AAC.1
MMGRGKQPTHAREGKATGARECRLIHAASSRVRMQTREVASEGFSTAVLPPHDGVDKRERDCARRR